MAKDNTLAVSVGIAIVCLLVGLLLGSLAFPQTTVVEKPKIEYVDKIVTEQEPFNYNDFLDFCPEAEECETATTLDFDAYLWIDEDWEYILDNWDTEDFDDELESCDRHKYDLDEIEWDIKDRFKYIIKDIDKPWYFVEFTVTGEYDNECEADYKIIVEHYKNRDLDIEINP